MAEFSLTARQLWTIACATVDIRLDEKRFLDLLGRVIAFTPKLQNSPDAGLVPEERLPAEVVLETLRPYIDSGFIEAQSLAAPGHEARPSLVLTIRGEEPGAIGFVGAHFDVVPADKDAEGWERDPFTLWVGDDGTLYARGVTDCLGHVALLTDFLAQLGEKNLRPKRTLKVVLIANEEEAPLPEIGLDYVVAQGQLDDLKDGTIYWLDSADFGPTVGTGGVAMWALHVTGVTGHSGMTQNCVNALELSMATSRASWSLQTSGGRAASMLGAGSTVSTPSLSWPQPAGWGLVTRMWGWPKRSPASTGSAPAGTVTVIEAQRRTAMPTTGRSAHSA